MAILVTGGAGYICSHTVIELISNGYEVVIVDNLCNSKINVLDRIEMISGVRVKFYEIDCCDKEMMDSKVVLSRHNTLINSIKRSSPESVAEAANYVHNFKKVEIRKDLEDYIEIMKLHIEVIDILEKAAKEKEQNDKLQVTK